MIDCTKIPYQDKGCHFIAGLIIGAISMYFVDVWSIAIVLATAIGKEMYDVVFKGMRLNGLDFDNAMANHFDYFDAIATVGGGWIGIALVGILNG